MTLAVSLRRVSGGTPARGSGRQGAEGSGAADTVVLKQQLNNIWCSLMWFKHIIHLEGGKEKYHGITVVRENKSYRQPQGYDECAGHGIRFNLQHAIPTVQYRARHSESAHRQDPPQHGNPLLPPFWPCPTSGVWPLRFQLRFQGQRGAGVAHVNAPEYGPIRGCTGTPALSV